METLLLRFTVGQVEFGSVEDGYSATSRSFQNQGIWLLAEFLIVWMCVPSSGLAGSSRTPVVIPAKNR